MDLFNYGKSNKLFCNDSFFRNYVFYIFKGFENFKAFHKLILCYHKESIILPVLHTKFMNNMSSIIWKKYFDIIKILNRDIDLIWLKLKLND